MKKQITTLCLMVILLFTTSIQTKAQKTPDKEEFIAFWVEFKNATRDNDAKYLFSHTVIPFKSEGAYYNTEAYLEDIEVYYKEIYPPYLHDMDFVRFDVVMVENAGACIWLGFDYIEKNYFYCYKIMEPGGNLESDTYEEKYYFKKVGKKGFMFYRMTAGNSGIEY